MITPKNFTGAHHHNFKSQTLNVKQQEGKKAFNYAEKSNSQSNSNLKLVKKVAAKQRSITKPQQHHHPSSGIFTTKPVAAEVLEQKIVASESGFNNDNIKTSDDNENKYSAAEVITVVPLGQIANGPANGQRRRQHNHTADKTNENGGGSYSTRVQLNDGDAGADRGGGTFRMFQTEQSVGRAAQRYASVDKEDFESHVSLSSCQLTDVDGNKLSSSRRMSGYKKVSSDFSNNKDPAQVSMLAHMKSGTLAQMTTTTGVKQFKTGSKRNDLLKTDEIRGGPSAIQQFNNFVQANKQQQQQLQYLHQQQQQIQLNSERPENLRKNPEYLNSKKELHLIAEKSAEMSRQLVHQQINSQLSKVQSVGDLYSMEFLHQQNLKTTVAAKEPLDGGLSCNLENLYDTLTPKGIKEQLYQQQQQQSMTPTSKSKAASSSYRDSESLGFALSERKKAHQIKQLQQKQFQIEKQQQMEEENQDDQEDTQQHQQLLEQSLAEQQMLFQKAMQHVEISGNKQAETGSGLTMKKDGSLHHFQNFSNAADSFKQNRIQKSESTDFKKSAAAERTLQRLQYEQIYGDSRKLYEPPATVKNVSNPGSQANFQLQEQQSPTKMHASRTKKPKEKPIDEEVIKYFKRMVKNQQMDKFKALMNSQSHYDLNKEDQNVSPRQHQRARQQTAKKLKVISNATINTPSIVKVAIESKTVDMVLSNSEDLLTASHTNPQMKVTTAKQPKKSSKRHLVKQDLIVENLDSSGAQSKELIRFKQPSHNSTGNIQQDRNSKKVQNNILVPKLALDKLKQSNDTSHQNDEEPVINIVTGGSFGRQNNTNSQRSATANTTTITQNKQKVYELQQQQQTHHSSLKSQGSNFKLFDIQKKYSEEHEFQRTLKKAIVSFQKLQQTKSTTGETPYNTTSVRSNKANKQSTSSLQPNQQLLSKSDKFNASAQSSNYNVKLRGSENTHKSQRTTNNNSSSQSQQNRVNSDRRQVQPSTAPQSGQLPVPSVMNILSPKQVNWTNNSGGKPVAVKQSFNSQPPPHQSSGDYEYEISRSSVAKKGKGSPSAMLKKLVDQDYSATTKLGSSAECGQAVAEYHNKINNLLTHAHNTVQHSSSSFARDCNFDTFGRPSATKEKRKEFSYILDGAGSASPIVKNSMERIDLEEQATLRKLTKRKKLQKQQLIPKPIDSTTKKSKRFIKTKKGQPGSGKMLSVGSNTGTGSLLGSKRCSTSHFGIAQRSQQSSAAASKESSNQKRMSIVSSLSKKGSQHLSEAPNLQSEKALKLIPAYSGVTTTPAAKKSKIRKASGGSGQMHEFRKAGDSLHSKDNTSTNQNDLKKKISTIFKVQQNSQDQTLNSTANLANVSTLNQKILTKKRRINSQTGAESGNSLRRQQPNSSTQKSSIIIEQNFVEVKKQQQPLLDMFSPKAQPQSSSKKLTRSRGNSNSNQIGHLQSQLNSLLSKRHQTSGFIFPTKEKTKKSTISSTKQQYLASATKQSSYLPQSSSQKNIAEKKSSSKHNHQQPTTNNGSSPIASNRMMELQTTQAAQIPTTRTATVAYQQSINQSKPTHRSNQTKSEALKKSNSQKQLIETSRLLAKQQSNLNEQGLMKLKKAIIQDFSNRKVDLMSPRQASIITSHKSKNSANYESASTATLQGRAGKSRNISDQCYQHDNQNANFEYNTTSNNGRMHFKTIAVPSRNGKHQFAATTTLNQSQKSGQRQVASGENLRRKDHYQSLLQLTKESFLCKQQQTQQQSQQPKQQQHQQQQQHYSLKRGAILSSTQPYLEKPMLNSLKLQSKQYSTMSKQQKNSVLKRQDQSAGPVVVSATTTSINRQNQNNRGKQSSNSKQRL